MKLDYQCINCHTDCFEVIYEGRVRSGLFGNKTSGDFKVISCSNCGLKRLYPFADINYKSSDYREAYNGSSDSDDYIQMHDQEQNPRLANIGIERFRNKIVLDYGCGGGSFLDAVKGVSKKTIGIEPFEGFHSSLSNRGHEIYAKVEDALSKYKGHIDVIISFGVIEHTDHPINYLRNAFDLLKIGGSIFLETDNHEDFLMFSDIPEFKEFFYRTVHYWYFEKDSLSRIFHTAGYKELNYGFRHGYDLSNAMMWMKDKKPTGLNAIPNISKICNQSWVNHLEQNGQAELLFFSATKES